MDHPPFRHALPNHSQPDIHLKANIFFGDSAVPAALISVEDLNPIVNSFSNIDAPILPGLLYEDFFHD